MKRIQIEKEEVNLFLFSDDMIVYVEHLKDSTEECVSKERVGFKLNLGKLTLLHKCYIVAFLYETFSEVLFFYKNRKYHRNSRSVIRFPYFSNPFHVKCFDFKEHIFISIILGVICCSK